MDAVTENDNKQLYRSLLKDYEDALYQLAEARLHIDRLRFGGAHVNIHKHFILTHSVEQQQQSNDPAMEENDYGSFVGKTCKESITGDQFAIKRAAAVKQIAELQHRLLALHERTEHSEISLDEVQSELLDIHQMHQNLATDLAVMMDAADNETYSDDPESMKIKHELMVLAQQLQDFITLLQDKEETILNTTMRRRRSSSLGMNTNHQQNTNKVKSNDSVEDIQQHRDEQVEPGWIMQKEKLRTTAPGREGLPTPPYTPLTKDLSYSRTAERDHTNDSQSKASNRWSPRKSKIPVYSGVHHQTGPTTCSCNDDTACSTIDGSCSNLSLHHHNDNHSLQKQIKKATFSQPLETTRNDNPMQVKGTPKICHHKAEKSKLPFCSKCCCKDSQSEHPLEQQQEDNSHRELHDKRNKKNSMRVNDCSADRKRSTTPPTIIIDHESSTLGPPSFSTHRQTTNHHRPSSFLSPHYSKSRPADHSDDSEKKRIDKSVTATPRMADKGIQVDASQVSPLTTPVKHRRKKKHHKRRPNQVQDSSLLSSDESFVTLIEPKDFFKTLSNHHHSLKRRNRNGSYKDKENPGTPRGDNYRRKSSTSISSRRKKPLYQVSTPRKCNKTPVYNESTSLESTNDTLSSSSDTTIVNSLPSRNKFYNPTNHQSQSTKGNYSSLLHSRIDNNNNGNPISCHCKSDDCRRPHSDTSILGHSSRPIVHTSRPIPIPSVSRPVPIPCHRHQKDHQNVSLNLDEAMDLAKKLKNSSKRMNSALLYDTYLPRYSV